LILNDLVSWSHLIRVGFSFLPDGEVLEELAGQPRGEACGEDEPKRQHQGKAALVLSWMQDLADFRKK